MIPLGVLIVEDDSIIAMKFAEVLEGMGRHVSAMQSTEDCAISAAMPCKPTLMIVDARLVYGNGVMVVSRILLSGFIPHCLRQRCICLRAFARAGCGDTSETVRRSRPCPGRSAHAQRRRECRGTILTHCAIPIAARVVLADRAL